MFSGHEGQPLQIIIIHSKVQENTIVAGGQCHFRWNS